MGDPIMETGVAGRGRSPGLSRELIFRLRGLIPVPAALIVIAWSNPSFESIAYGAIFLLIGEAIRVWAAGYIQVYRVAAVGADRLVTAGPYAFVRNPLYWGNFLIGLGYAHSANWWPAYLIFGALYLYIYSSVIPHEEEYLSRTFKDDYATYRKSVPRFLPRLSRYPGANGRFSFGVAIRSEVMTLATIGVMMALFAVKALI